MAQKRIIAGLLFGCILVLSGCRREDVPAVVGEAIRFSVDAGLTSLEVPDTKVGELKESFNINDKVLVYGRRNTNDPVFEGVTVTKTGTGWSYTTPVYWKWVDNADYYDFLAVSQPTGIPIYPDYDVDVSPLTLSVPYDPASGQFDLMLAGTRRINDANRITPVPLAFQHMLCAVQLKVTNESSEKGFRLLGYHFENLISLGTTSVSVDAQGNPAFSWTDLIRMAAPIGGMTPSGGSWDMGKTDENRTYTFNGVDLMIPQSHDGKIGTDGYAALVVSYKPESSEVTRQARVLLKDVKTTTANPVAISSWERGVKYVYEIVINPDGGILVHLTPMPWDAVAAATPGLLIPPDLIP